MRRNKIFYVLAAGHYGAEPIVVNVRLVSQRKDKQLLELDYLESAVQQELAKHRAIVAALPDDVEADREDADCG